MHGYLKYEANVHRIGEMKHIFSKDIIYLVHVHAIMEMNKCFELRHGWPLKSLGINFHSQA